MIAEQPVCRSLEHPWQLFCCLLMEPWDCVDGRYVKREEKFGRTGKFHEANAACIVIEEQTVIMGPLQNLIHLNTLERR